MISLIPRVLKKGYKWTYFQNRNRVTDVENKLTVTKGEKINWEIGTDLHTLLYIKERANKKALESPLDCKEIKQVNPKGNQFWIVMRGTDTEAEVPILWLPDAKSYLTEKTLMLGKIESRRRRGRGWDGWGYHQLDGHKFEQVLGVGDGQGSLACCSP